MELTFNFDNQITRELCILFDGTGEGNVLVGENKVQGEVKSDLDIKEGMEIWIRNNEDMDPDNYKQCEINKVFVAEVQTVLEDGYIKQVVYTNISHFTYYWHEYELLGDDKWSVQDIESNEYLAPISTQEVINRVKNTYKEQRAKDLMKTE